MKGGGACGGGNVTVQLAIARAMVDVRCALARRARRAHDQRTAVQLRMCVCARCVCGFVYERVPLDCSHIDRRLPRGSGGTSAAAKFLLGSTPSA